MAEKCKCFACQNGMEKLDEIQKKCIETHGWYAHYVMGDPKCPANTNCHTHNLMEKFGHKDLQICLNISPPTVHMLFETIIEHIKEGRKFESGKKYDDIFEGIFQAEFIDAIECGRKVLRLLIPDPNGKYEGKYAVQLTKLNNTEFNPNLN